jgi:hypothetical protein
MALRLMDRLRGRDISSLADDRLIEEIGRFFGEDFSRVYFTLGGILPHVVPFHYSAIVFGDMVNIRRGAEKVLSDPCVMAEELFHVIQWRRMGLVRIAVRYLYYHVTRGYAGNPIEREAKAQADRFVAHQKSQRHKPGPGPV